jgi:uracil-DNA glycosylase
MKNALYNELVIQRKECRSCRGLGNPASADLREYDSGEIGPWTRLHGDLEAEIMVVGQDWGDTAYFKANRGLDNLRNPTMLTLEKLFRASGFGFSLQGYDHGERGLFLTNAILCLKAGGLQAKVEPSWFKNCGKLFLRRQIEIISPKVVVALGQRAHEAILAEFGVKKGRFREAVESKQGVSLPGGSQFGGHHTCAAGQGRVIQRVGNPPRKVGQPTGSESLEGPW